ncbi:MAG TPA: LacI family DNA-binding transcriptional regulator [Chthonomonadales bacterium]|nr:LacI family DNA-binding transcriptional regulator [Chthonomonadales bacterium]
MVKRISTISDRYGATMRDVAETAGVSQATVSYVLSGKEGARVGATTRMRVLDAAARLRYTPNAIARAMALGKSGIVGVYQPHTGVSPLAGMWTAAVMRGVGAGLHQESYHLLLYGYLEDKPPAGAAFLDGSVDGLIIIASHEADSLPLQLAEAGFPTAIIGGAALSGGTIVTADANNVAGGRMAAAHLIELGHSCIVHLAGPREVPNAEDRRKGFEIEIAERGAMNLADCVVEAGFDELGGYRGARAALDRFPRATGLFAANDIAALGAIDACRDLGYRIPQDISIIGYDDAPICQITQPALTSIRQPAEEMGCAAARRLLQMIRGESAAGHYVFEPTLSVRSSTSAPTERRT